MKTVIALAGAAHIHTPSFVKKLAAREDISVRWVWDPDPAVAAKRAEILNARVAGTPSQIWDDTEVSAAVITSQTDLHEELVMPACAAGKHLFVEKPLGFRAADAGRMASAIESAGVIFQTGYFMRGQPHFQFLKKAFQAGYFGDVTRIWLSNGHAGSLQDWFTPEWLWMTDPGRAGSGAFGDLGTHILDILLWLHDSPIKLVTATMDTSIQRYGPNCDEYGQGMLRFEDSVLAVLSAGWVDYADPVKVVVSGTAGYARLIEDRLYFQSEHVPGSDGKTPWRDLPGPQPHAFDIFLNAITEPGADRDFPGLVSPAEAALRSRVMEALYQAAAAKTWLPI